MMLHDSPNYWGVVMPSIGFPTAFAALVLSVNLAGAQSLAQIGGPANLPPAGFSGQQFVDNRGCLFLKAGFGGAVNWVPRVDRLHHPLCNFPPTFGAAVATAAPQPPAPAPVAAKPLRLTITPAENPAVSNAIPKPPKGYKLAWKDDRLNPLRGIGTAAGQAQQDLVWTRDVPAVLVTAPVLGAAQQRVVVSTMSGSAAQAASGKARASGPEQAELK
jgi:hypothetical protein